MIAVLTFAQRAPALGEHFFPEFFGHAGLGQLILHVFRGHRALLLGPGQNRINNALQIGSHHGEQVPGV